MNSDVRGLVVSSLQEMNYDTGDLTGDTVLGPSGLDLDSLSVTEIAVRVEDAFGAKFFDEDMERVPVMTLDEFVAEIVSRAQPAKVGGELE
jgi:acyl carrier protein